MSRDKQKSNGAKQSDILVGIALLLLAAVFAYLGFSQPKISNDYTVSQTQTEMYSPDFNIQPDTEGGTLTDEQNSVTYAADESAVSEMNVDFPLDLNTCTKEELMAIDGIGDVRAASIIAYREHLGGYTSVEQLKDISGIGDALYEKIVPYVTI